MCRAEVKKYIWENNPSAHLVYDLSKQFPNEFLRNSLKPRLKQAIK